MTIEKAVEVITNAVQRGEMTCEQDRYNGTVNAITGDYAHQENTIEIRKSDSADLNISDAALEYDKILNSLNDSDREMLISQVRAIAGTFKKK